MSTVSFVLNIVVNDGKAIIDVSSLAPDIIAMLTSMANGKEANASGRINLVFSQAYVGAQATTRPADKVNFPLVQLAVYSSSNLDELGQAEKRLARRESMLASDRAKIANIKMAQTPAPAPAPVVVAVRCSACSTNPATIARVNEKGKAFKLCARCAKRIVK